MKYLSVSHRVGGTLGTESHELAYAFLFKDIIKLPFSSGVILPKSAEDSEDWSPPSIVVSSPQILSLSELCGEVTIIDGGHQSSAADCGGLESSTDIGRIAPDENGSFTIMYM